MKGFIGTIQVQRLSFGRFSNRFTIDLYRNLCIEVWALLEILTHAYDTNRAFANHLQLAFFKFKDRYHWTFLTSRDTKEVYCGGHWILYKVDGSGGLGHHNRETNGKFCVEDHHMQTWDPTTNHHRQRNAIPGKIWKMLWKRSYCLDS